MFKSLLKAGSLLRSKLDTFSKLKRNLPVNQAVFHRIPAFHQAVKMPLILKSPPPDRRCVGVVPV